MFANNPTLVAWVQAQQLYPEAKFIVLSIGCGTRSANYPVNGTWGPLEWFDPTNDVPLIDVLMRGQGDLVDSQMAMLLARDKTYFRLQFSLDNSLHGDLDDASAENLSDMLARADATAASVRGKKSISGLIAAMQQVEAVADRTT